MGIQDVGGVPTVVTSGGYGYGDGCGMGGGWLGMLVILALFGGFGRGGFGGWGGGYGCGGGCGGPGYDFSLQRDILENRYTSEKNTGVIVHNQDICTGKILDKMTNIEMQNLRDKINGYETALSEQRITATILQNLQPPRAIPAYIEKNPYTPYVPPYFQPREGFPCGQPC